MRTKVIVASQNPVKIEASREGFTKMFPNGTFVITGVSAPSGVSDQPMTDQETLIGALNRLEFIRHQYPEAGYWIAIEGGIEIDQEGMACFAWVVAASSGPRIGKSRTGCFYLPSRVAELVAGGMELGTADDLVFGQTNTKQGQGASGLLTGGAVTRAGFYEQAVIFALIPFRNAEFY